MSKFAIVECVNCDRKGRAGVEARLLRTGRAVDGDDAEWFCDKCGGFEVDLEEAEEILRGEG